MPSPTSRSLPYDAAVSIKPVAARDRRLDSGGGLRGRALEDAEAESGISTPLFRVIVGVAVVI